MKKGTSYKTRPALDFIYSSKKRFVNFFLVLTYLYLILYLLI